jgi:NADH-quinone oxidoreductase subunit K
MNHTPLEAYLLLSALLFCIGLAGVLTRRNAILVLLGIELMLNAANLNFIAFWRYGPNPQALSGFVVVLFSIAVAAAEAAVGLALVISVYRHYQSADLDALASDDAAVEEPASPDQVKSGSETSSPGASR